jgi:flagellar motility protein MotE (MotC chaperone)
MTGGKPALWPMPRGIVRALWLAAAGVLMFLGTAALAQQGWEPMVSVGANPARTRPPTQARTAAPKHKPAALAEAAQKEVVPELPPPVRLEAPAKAPLPSLSGVETASIKGPRAEEYCANIADAAADARFAWQKKLISDMEQEIAKRIALLEEKMAEYQKWLARRDEFSRKANETLLRIYSRMRPDAAATQLAALDEETAAAVLIKLEPRLASLILNEMESTQAVRLAATISGAGKLPPPGGQRATAEAKAK